MVDERYFKRTQIVLFLQNVKKICCKKYIVKMYVKNCFKNYIVLLFNVFVNNILRDGKIVV